MVGSSHHGNPGSIFQWSQIFSPVWIVPAEIPECEGSIPPFGFHWRLPMGERKLFCMTLLYKDVGFSEVDRERVGYCLQKWKRVGEILG